MRNLALLVIACALVLVPASFAQGPQLVNPSFEGNFQRWQGIPEVEVPVGWEPSWLGDDRQCPRPCHRPEYKPEYEGDICQTGACPRWFTTFARHFATLSQQVDVQEGAWYEFSCDVYNISEPDGRMGVFVGINPWGGDPFHRTMIWGKEHTKPYREWTRVSVTAQAFGGKIRVVLGGNNEWPSHNNAAYWDNCTLRKVSEPTSPDPLPTYTPYPTYTPRPVGTPCPTCIPGSGNCPSIDSIQEAIETVVAGRDPVRWPR